MGRLVMTCDNLWQLVTTYGDSRQLVQICDHLWHLLTIFDNLWWVKTTFDHLWRVTMTFDNLHWLVTSCDNLWQLLTACNDLWQLVMTSDNCDTLWQHVKPETLRRYWTNCKFWKSVTDRQTDRRQKTEWVTMPVLERHAPLKTWNIRQIIFW